MSDIVERLRKLWFAQNPKLTWDDMEAITEEAAAEITRLRAENEKLRNEVMSDYHEGWEEGVKAERERCARIVEIHAKAVDGDKIAAAIRESGE